MLKLLDLFCGGGGAAKAWLYNGITISAFDTPNLQGNGRVVPGLITQLDVEETAQEYGEESPMYMAKVRAEFPDSLSDAIVSRSDIMAAVERDLTPEATEHIFAKWTVKPRFCLLYTSPSPRD